MFGGGGAIGTLLLQRLGLANPIPAVRTLRLFSPSPATQLQDVFAAGEVLTFLVHDFAAGRFAVGAVSVEGKPLWRERLPRSFYLSLGPNSIGTITLHSLGGPDLPGEGMVDLDPKTSQTRVLGQIQPGPRLRPIHEDAFVRVLPEGTLEIVEVDRDNSRILVRSVTSLPKHAADARLEPLTRTSVALVDQEWGKLSIVDLNTGVVADHAIDSPVIADGLSFYGGLRKEMGAEKEYHPTVLAASGPGSGGTIYCLASPFDLDGTATVLEVTGSGAVKRQIRVVLPERGSAGFSVPIQLVQLGRSIAVIFAHGGVAVYPLS